MLHKCRPKNARKIRGIGHIERSVIKNHHRLPVFGFNLEIAAYLFGPLASQNDPKSKHSMPLALRALTKLMAQAISISNVLMQLMQTTVTIGLTDKRCAWTIDLSVIYLRSG